MASFTPAAKTGLRIAIPAEMTIQPLADALSKLAASPFRSTAVEITTFVSRTIGRTQEGRLGSGVDKTTPRR